MVTRLLALLALAPALAQAGAPTPAEPLPWVIGRSLGQVSLEAASGELPADNLVPLLRARQGQPFDPQLLRSDLAVLYSTGLFAAVEAEVQEGVGFGPDGEPELVVWLAYRVVPALELRRVEVDGVRRLSGRDVRHAVGVSPGGRLFPETELADIERRILARYDAEGFVGTQATVEVAPLDDGRVDLNVVVREGAPQRVGELRFGGELPLPERRLRAQLWAVGLWRGRRLDARALRAGRERVEQLLWEEGYPSARVRALTLPAEGEGASGVRVLMIVEPGDQALIELTEEDWRWQRRAERWLEPAIEGRLSASSADDIEEQLLRAAREAGFADAQGSVVVTEEPGLDRVAVSLSPGRRYSLTRAGVVFQGSAHFDADYLREALYEASPEVLGRGRYTEEALDEGLAALRDLYRSQGYLSVHLERVHVARSEGPLGGRLGGRIEARVEVEEGPRTELRSLMIEGVAPELQGRWQAQVVEMSGGPFQPAAVRSLTEEIVLAHRALGYFGADARSRTAMSDDGLSADTTLTVTPGEQLYLRNVIIRGTRRTRRRVIEREVTLATGDVIRPDDLAALRAELYDLNAFSVVSLELQGEGDRVRDLVIDVREQPAWSFEVGGGLATDEGLRGFGRFTRRNIFGLGHSFSALGQIGFGYSGNEWRLDTSSAEWRAGLRYEAPTRQQLFFVDVLLNEQEQEPTYRLLSTGADVGVELELAPGRQLALSYGAQWRSLDDVDPGALVSPDPWLDVLGVRAPTEETLYLPSAWRRQGGLSLQAIVDQRDDPFNPKRGGLFSLQVEAYDPLSSGFWGVRALGQAQVIQPLGPVGLQLRGQGGVGGVRGRGTTLALEDRFRLGGASTLRGYPLDSVGPKNAVAVDDLALPAQLDDLAAYLGRDNTERWVPTGGDAMLLGTAELRVPMPLLGFSGWTGTELVGFADVGNVFLLDPTVFTSSERIDPEPFLRYGVGVGVHQATPVGPLQVDVGVNPMYFRASWPEARGEVPVRLHISLGAL